MVLVAMEGLHAYQVCGKPVALLIGALPRRFSRVDLSCLGQEESEARRSSYLTSLVCAAKRGFGIGQVAARSEYESEMKCGRAVATLVSALECGFGPCQVSSIFKY